MWVLIATGIAVGWFSVLVFFTALCRASGQADARAVGEAGHASTPLAVSDLGGPRHTPVLDIAEARRRHARRTGAPRSLASA
jgi:hypothetical protein